MRNRITSKQIEICDRKFEIKKLSAFTGSFIAIQLVTKTLPVGLASVLKLPITPSGQGMTEEETVSLQKSILSCVSEVLPAGKTPILDKSGNFAVMDIENDMAMVMRLTIDAVYFNFSDFFDVKLWEGLLPPELFTMLSSLLTSTNLFTHRSSEDTGNNVNSGTEPTT